ncbi:hypothetical protein [Nocardia brasiliensis]
MYAAIPAPTTATALPTDVSNAPTCTVNRRKTTQPSAAPVLAAAGDFADLTDRIINRRTVIRFSPAQSNSVQADTPRSTSGSV